RRSGGVRAAMIRTVLGDIDSALLGATNYHEHLFQVSPLLPGDELDDEEASRAEAQLLRGSGFTAMIDATPFGLGRNPEALARISASTGLHVVAATGRHREAHYPGAHPARAWRTAELAALFVAELTTGMSTDDADLLRGSDATGALAPDGRRVRAGIVKTGIDYWRISDFERRTREDTATAHRES